MLVLFVRFPSESEAQWRSVQVSSPAGVFCSPPPPLHRCLLAYMSCHMFSTRPPPEGAKSVFAHNLHSLTRPSLPLTGAHGVAFMKHSRGITPAFSFFFFSSLLPELLDNLSEHLPLYFHIPSLRSGWKEISMHIIHICKRYLLSKAKSNSVADFTSQMFCYQISNISVLGQQLKCFAPGQHDRNPLSS